MSEAKNIFLRHIVASIAKLQHDLETSVDQPLCNELRERTLALLNVLLQSETPTEWIATRNLLLLFAPKMEQAGFRSEWIPYLRRALDLSTVVDDQHGKAGLGLQLGILYQLRGEWKLAKEILKSSADVYHALREHRPYANILNRLGFIACHQGELSRAQQYANQALELLNQEENERHFSFHVLGTVAREKQDWTEAETYIRQSLEICQRTSDIRNQARRHRDLGLILDQKDELRLARECYERAINMFEEQGDLVEAAVTKMNLGIIYSKLGNPQQALNHYSEAKQVFQEVHDELQLSYVLVNQGVDYQGIERFSEAKQAYKSAIELRKHVGSPASVISVQIPLGELYIQTHNYLDASDIFHNALLKLDEIDEPTIAERYRSEIETSLNQLSKKVDEQIWVIVCSSTFLGTQ